MQVGRFLRRSSWIGFSGLLALPLAADGARILDAAGDRNYADVQAAIEDAVDGDIILVGEGNYGSLLIDGKGIAVFAAPGEQVRIDGTVTIRNLTWHNVVLSGLDVQPVEFATALTLVNNSGHVRLLDCTFTGGSDVYAGGFGGPGASLSTSVGVDFVNCIVQGGNGVPNLQVYQSGGQGGLGAHVDNTFVQFFTSTVRGGDGGDGEDWGGDGADALVATDSWLSVSGCIVRGGDAGIGYYSGGGDGGDGLRLGRNAQAGLLDSQFSAGIGYGYSYGVPIHAPFGGVTQYGGTVRRFTLPSVASDQTSLVVTVQGVPGDQAFLFTTKSFLFAPIPGQSGVWSVPLPLLFPARPLGVVPGSGVLTARVPLPDLPAGLARERRIFQGLVLPSAGGKFLSGPLHMTRLNRDVGPDCNNNGTSDYVDVLEGLAPDQDHNLVPDTCEWSGPDWYVDAAAPLGGTGGPTDPFRTIALGLEKAASGHVVHVADGVYTGPSNRNLSFGGRDIVVRGVNGPANCVIDCQSLGRAFELTQGESPSARVEGLTIRNGNGSLGSPGINYAWGGGILVMSSDATIAGCVVENCTAVQSGGGIALWWSDSEVRNCTIRNNSATTDGQIGGGGISTFGVSRIVGCLIEGNTSVGGGGGVQLSGGQAPPGQPSQVLSHCVIRNNTAQGSGAVYVRGGWETRIDNCLIADNFGVHGGAISQMSSHGLTIADTTIVNNQTPGKGGAIISTNTAPGGCCAHQSDVILDNTIVWGNTSGSGTAIDMWGVKTVLHVNYSLVEGGQSAVTLGYQAGLAWGAGNVTSDPLLTPTYELGPGSPAIDAGDNSRVPPDWADVDGDGDTAEPVPLDLAFLPRFRDDPAVPDTGNGTAPIVDVGCCERQ